MYVDLLFMLLSFVHVHIHPVPLSYPTFTSVIHDEIWIRKLKAYFGKWDCMKGCFHVRNPYKLFEPFHSSDEKTQQNTFAVSDKQTKHIFTRYNQRQAYRDIWDNIDTDTVLVAQDFGTLKCHPNAAINEHYVTDFCIYLRWKTAGGDEKRLYVDLICDDKTRKNDYFYLRHSWRFLLSSSTYFTPFKNIIIFSDGASKHFKSRYTMKFFSDIGVEFNKKVSYHFFASYHGSGVWDAHFASNNGAIRRFLLEMEKQRYKRESLDFSPLSELKTLVEVLLKSLSNTVVHEFQNIDRSMHLKPDVRAIIDIKSHHYFEFIGTNTINCSILSGNKFPNNRHQFSNISRSSTSSSSTTTATSSSLSGRRLVVKLDSIITGQLMCTNSRSSDLYDFESSDDEKNIEPVSYPLQHEEDEDMNTDSDFDIIDDDDHAQNISETSPRRSTREKTARKTSLDYLYEL